MSTREKINITEVGIVEILETYVFYDQPLLFSFQDKDKRLFIGVAAAETDIDFVWLYAEISVARLDAVRHGLVDLHEAFAETESGYLLQETVDKNDKDHSNFVKIRCDDVSEDMIPKRDERLDIEKPKSIVELLDV